jgi:hypothetical protein
LRKTAIPKKDSEKSNTKLAKSEASQKSITEANVVMKSDSEEDLGISRKKGAAKRRVVDSSSEDDVLPPSKPLP